MATKKTGATGKAAPLDPKVADKLLDMLGTDNEFRRLFKKDPGAALVKAGYKVPKGDAAAADNLRSYAQRAVEKIAPKAGRAEGAQEIKTSLLGTGHAADSVECVLRRAPQAQLIGQYGPGQCRSNASSSRFASAGATCWRAARPPAGWPSSRRPR